MMKLSTMWNGDRRLDTRGELPVAAAVLARWPHDPGSLAIFRYSSNFIFTFTDAGRRRFPRTADHHERNRASITAEVDLLLWLNAAGIDLAPPLPSLTGDLVETMDTGHGVFHGVVFPALAGEQFETDDLDRDAFTAWGATLGRLHAALQRYDGPAAAARGSWRDTLAFIQAHVPAGERAVHREADHLAAALAALPANRDTFGLIHGDFELDNLIWQRQGIGIIDFDDYTQHWYAADIAFALRDLFDHGADVGEARVQAFLAGYAEHHPLDDAMVSSLPIFSRLARLTTFARIARSLDLPADSRASEWVVALQDRLQPRMASYRASLSR